MIETALNIGLFAVTVSLIVPIYYKLGRIEHQLKVLNGVK